MKFRASYHSMSVNHKTKWYSSRKEAQFHLVNAVGFFHPLGEVSGDVFEGGVCNQAPRLNGEVRIEVKQ